MIRNWLTRLYLLERRCGVISIFLTTRSLYSYFASINSGGGLGLSKKEDFLVETILFRQGLARLSRQAIYKLAR
jgi:hypothetical protein